MANQVIVEYIGNPDLLFRVADQVERRLQDLQRRMQAASSANPAVQQQRSLADAVKRSTTTMVREFAQAETSAASLNRQLREMARNGGSIPQPPTPIVLQRAQAAARAMTPEQAAANDARMQEVREQIASRRIQRQQEREFKAMRTSIARQDQLRSAEARTHALRVNARRAAADQIAALERRETDVVVRESERRRSLLDPASRRRTAISALAIYAGHATGAPGLAAGATGFEMAKLAGLSTAGAGAIGGGAAIGGVLIAASERLRTNSEARLAAEEKTAGAYSGQVLAIEGIIKGHERTMKALEEQRRLSEFLVRNEKNLSGLQDRRTDLLNQRALITRQIYDSFKFFGVGTSSEQLQREGLAKRLEALNQELERVSPATDALSRSRTGFSPADSEANRRFFEESRRKQEEWQQQVEAGRKRVEELGKTWRDTLSSLTLQANQDNPFVRVFQDADRAMRELRENLKGLPAEMQRAAVQSQQAFNASQLFGARVDSALSALDLREMAARFRDDTADRRRFSEDVLARDRAEFERRLGLGENFNAAAVRESLDQRQRLIDLRYRDESPSERLDRQLEAIRRIRPEDETQQAMADRRVLQIAQGLDPNDLRRDQRESIAQIAERAAEREETRFKAALEIQKKQEIHLKRISDHVDALLKKALSGGLAAVNQAVEITVKDETSDGIRTLARRASPQDVADYYSGRLSAGPGGLTNR